MKKSIFLTAILLLLSTLLLVFSSCGECEHVWEEKGYVAKKPTDKEVGHRIFTCTLCGDKKSEEIPMLSHSNHEYVQWSGDNTHHWFVCNYLDCTATTNKSNHIYADSPNGGFVCSICQIKSTDHQFSDNLKYDDKLHWVLCDDEGCPTIAYKGPHSLPQHFEYDSEFHWGFCTFANCPAVAFKAEHTLKDGKCTVCDYEKSTD